MFQIIDCLADHVIDSTIDRIQADEMCAIHGGADNCINVFEVREKEVCHAQVKAEPRPRSGELF
jgi:hypothetical protein